MGWTTGSGSLSTTIGQAFDIHLFCSHVANKNVLKFVDVRLPFRPILVGIYSISLQQPRGELSGGNRASIRQKIRDVGRPAIDDTTAPTSLCAYFMHQAIKIRSCGHANLLPHIGECH